MKIHEVTEADGSLQAIELVIDGGRLALRRGAETMPLPDGALAAVIKRYGAEVDAAAMVTQIDSLDVGDGTLLHVRHHDLYDVIARDWLIYDGVCALATTVAGALEHLARRAGGGS